MRKKQARVNSDGIPYDKLIIPADEDNYYQSRRHPEQRIVVVEYTKAGIPSCVQTVEPERTYADGRQGYPGDEYYFEVCGGSLYHDIPDGIHNEVAPTYLWTPPDPERDTGCHWYVWLADDVRIMSGYLETKREIPREEFATHPSVTLYPKPLDLRGCFEAWHFQGKWTRRLANGKTIWVKPTYPVTNPLSISAEAEDGFTWCSVCQEHLLDNVEGLCRHLHWLNVWGPSGTGAHDNDSPDAEAVEESLRRMLKEEDWKAILEAMECGHYRIEEWFDVLKVSIEFPRDRAWRYHEIDCPDCPNGEAMTDEEPGYAWLVTLEAGVTKEHEELTIEWAKRALEERPWEQVAG